MSSCEENIQKLFEENPNLVDKEIIAKMKELKDEKGRRLYKTSTIASRLRQFRLKQQTSSELPVIEKADEDISIDASKSDAPELKNVNLEGAKKEVEEAFGRRNGMNNEGKKVYAFDFFDGDSNLVEHKFMSQDEADDYAIKTNTVCKLSIIYKKVEPQETKSGNVIYDGRKRTEAINKETTTEKEVDNSIIGTNKKPQEIDLVNEKIMTALEQIHEKIDKMGKEILLLKQGDKPVDELVDVQLRESIINMLDELKIDDSEDFSETIKLLVEQKDEVKKVIPSFLEKISLDKDGSAHGKLFMHDGRWKFLKRARPIIYGIVGASIGCISLFVLLVLLNTLELLPGWI